MGCGEEWLKDRVAGAGSWGQCECSHNSCDNVIDYDLLVEMVIVIEHPPYIHTRLKK